TPMRSVIGHGLQGGVDHGFDLLVADPAWRSAPGFIEQPRQPTLDVARTPFADGVIVDSELTRHLAVGDAVGTAEQDPGSLGEGVAGLGQFGPTDEFCAIFGGDCKRGFGTTELHDVSLIVNTGRVPVIIPWISVPRLWRPGSSIVGRNCGGLRTLVACSTAKASRISVASLNALPMNDMFTGNPKLKPAGTVTIG